MIKTMGKFCVNSQTLEIQYTGAASPGKPCCSNRETSQSLVTERAERYNEARGQVERGKLVVHREERVCVRGDLKISERR